MPTNPTFDWRAEEVIPWPLSNQKLCAELSKHASIISEIASHLPDPMVAAEPSKQSRPYTQVVVTGFLQYCVENIGTRSELFKYYIQRVQPDEKYPNFYSEPEAGKIVDLNFPNHQRGARHEIHNFLGRLVVVNATLILNSDEALLVPTTMEPVVTWWDGVNWPDSKIG